MLSCFSHARLSVIPWSVSCQAPLSMGLSRQEHSGGLLFPPPGDLPNPGIKPAFPTRAGTFCTIRVIWDALVKVNFKLFSQASCLNQLVVFIHMQKELVVHIQREKKIILTCFLQSLENITAILCQKTYLSFLQSQFCS